VFRGVGICAIGSAVAVGGGATTACAGTCAADGCDGCVAGLAITGLHVARTTGGGLGVGTDMQGRNDGMSISGFGCIEDMRGVTGISVPSAGTCDGIAAGDEAGAGRGVHSIDVTAVGSKFRNVDALDTCDMTSDCSLEVGVVVNRRDDSDSASQFMVYGIRGEISSTLIAALWIRCGGTGALLCKVCAITRGTSCTLMAALWMACCCTDSCSCI